MRNSIKVIDKDVPKVIVASLDRGQMFRFPKNSSDQNIYMVVDTGAVLLASGALYVNFNRDAVIEVIDAISIQR